MQLAKQHHEGVEFYDPAVEQHAPNRFALLGDLRRALETDDQITVYYQPKVHLHQGGLAGVEALVRWDHPALGRVAPDEFIPLTETTTLIHALTDRVLGIAVQQAVQWKNNGLHIPVAVNRSTRCLHDTTLPGRVFDLLERRGLPPSLLELEITESMVMADPQRALTVLDALHAGGIRLPVDELKIDRSFVQQMTAGDGGRVLVRTAVGLGHNLGMTIVAEGIEDADTALQLADVGCDIAQGYHFGRPTPAEDLYAWLRQHSSAGSLTAQ
jgi:EAL domain-containing protein (putative c-di-GMP-specific phosphodiesterase class I)